MTRPSPYRSATGTDCILDNELLIENLAHAIRKNAGNDIGGTTRSKGHREHHGP